MSDDRTFRDGVRYTFKDNGGVIHPGSNTVVNETGSPEYTFDSHWFEDLPHID